MSRALVLNRPMCLPLLRTATIETMRNKKTTQIIVWVIVIGMVLSLAIASISLLT